MALEHKPLILQNYMVATLIELLGVPLAGQIARARNRFILLFNETAKEIEAERQKLLKEYGDLDEKGELKIGTNGHYIMRDAEGFAKAFDELSKRTCYVPCKGEQLVDFHNIKNVLLNLELKLTVEQTTVYDEICKRFEEWASSEATPSPLNDEEHGAAA